MAQDQLFLAMQRKVWTGRVPLEIRLAPSECRCYDQGDPYIISAPRLSYLPLLLKRLHGFFAPQLIEEAEHISADTGFFTFQSVPLKWHLPLGLLYDIYVVASDEASEKSGNSLPWRLTLHFSPDSADTKVNLINPTAAVLHDSFINSVKEADFLRSGSAKPIMSLSANDSKALWMSAQQNDLLTFSPIYQALLPGNGQMRNIPVRVYMPSSPDVDDGPAQVRVFQSQIPQSNTVGTALHTMIPSLFPSRRTPILARPVLHGVVIPMSAQLEDLARWACYADGWLNLVIVMNG